MHTFQHLSSGSQCGVGTRALNYFRSRDLHRFPHIAISAAYLFLGYRFFDLINRFAVNLFTWDQWGFNDAVLFEDHSLWTIFRWQWGPHRLGLSGILAKALEPLVSWDTRYEAFGIGVIILLSALAALILRKRLFGRIGYPDLVIPLIFLTPSQHETLIAGEGPAPFAIPLLFVILYCLSWTLRSEPQKYAGVLITNLVLVYTGYGVFMGLVTPLLILFECHMNWKTITANYRLIVVSSLAICVVSLASFFVGYKQLPTMGCSGPGSSALNHLWFIDVMFASFLGVKATRRLTVALLIGASMVLAVSVGLLFLFRRLVDSDPRRWTVSIISFALLAYSALFSLVAAVGRGCLGLGVAEASRYVTPLIPGFLGFYFAALSMNNKFWKHTYIAVLWIVALLNSARIPADDWKAMSEYGAAKRAWKECYLAVHDIEYCTAQTHFYIIPRLDHTYIDNGRLQLKLDFLEQHHFNLYAGGTH